MLASCWWHAGGMLVFENKCVLWSMVSLTDCMVSKYLEMVAVIGPWFFIITTSFFAVCTLQEKNCYFDWWDILYPTSQNNNSLQSRHCWFSSQYWGLHRIEGYIELLFCYCLTCRVFLLSQHADSVTIYNWNEHYQQLHSIVYQQVHSLTFTVWSVHAMNLSCGESYYYKWLVTVCQLSGNTLPVRQ